MDDEGLNIELLSIYLEPDYDILGATSGQMALALAEGHPQPNLILLDITMPDMDGYETLSRLKASDATRRIPVIFLTALDHKEEEATGLDAGAVDYISKPIFPDTVRARVRIHLQHEDVLRQLNKAHAQLAAQKAEIKRVTEMRDKLVAMVKVRNARIAQLGAGPPGTSVKEQT